MPRTKQLSKSKPKSSDFLNECDLLAKDFKRQAKLRIHKFVEDSKMAIRNIEDDIDIALTQFPLEIRRLTLGEILLLGESEDEDENECGVSSSVNDFLLPTAPATVKSKKNTKRITGTSDDGYVTEGGTHKSRAVVASTSKARSIRKTRSSSTNSRTKLYEMNTYTARKQDKVDSSVKLNKFKTPASLKPPLNEFSVVTPKVKPNTALNVLRRPRQGEMVLSMQGSPLLVSAVVEERTANINVPLHDGNVISLLPNDGLRLSHIPNLDHETMRQLKTLKGHIEKVINSK